MAQEATATIGNQARTTNNDESFSKKLQQNMMNPSANCRTTTNIHLAPTMMNPAANSRPTSNQSCQPFAAACSKTMMIRLCTTNNDQSFSKKLQQSMMNPSANCRTTTNIHLAPTMMNPAANSRPTSNQSCQPFTAACSKMMMMLHSIL